jgi:hypothetical protein
VSMIARLEHAAKILVTYSEGTLPTPNYVSCGNSAISFLMDSPDDVTAWAKSTDVQVESDVYEGSRQTRAGFYSPEAGCMVYISHVVNEVPV